MSDVRLPIETIREGNKITKVCVEDIHKMINRIQDAMNKAQNNSVSMIDATEDLDYGKDSSIIHARGVSQPCITDAFDEEIGNDVAFIKMKLNGNIKIHNLLTKIWNEYMKVLVAIDKELFKIDYYVVNDLYRMRQYNPEYLKDIEYELGIFDSEDDEVQE